MTRKDRDRQIVEAWRSGRTSREVVEQFGLSRARVWQIILPRTTPEERRERRRDLGELNRARSKARLLETDAARNDDIVRRVRAGASFGEAARDLGLSRGTVAGAVRRARLREARA